MVLNERKDIMKESNEYKEALIRDGYYWKGKALAYEAVLRSIVKFKEPPILHFDELGKIKK